MQTPPLPTVGVIGLGAMGQGVARTLLRAGYPTLGCDLRPEALRAFEREGGIACPAPSAMGSRCQVLIVLVVNEAQTDEALFGAGGAAATLTRGSVVVACATVSPAYARDLGRRLSEHGILMVDAPVSGGAARAAEGKLTMMTSGPAEAYAKCEEVLSSMSAQVYHLGDQHGMGSQVKIVNQLLAGVHIAAMAEALALGIREGVDLKVLYEVITHSAGNSWMFENRAPHVIEGDYTSLSAVDIFVKDLGLVLDTARASKFPLPLSAAAHQMFMAASSAGHGREDDSAVIKIFPGITLPASKA
jgi:3-hydroxyisobutyrate dehydrogenase